MPVWDTSKLHKFESWMIRCELSSHNQVILRYVMLHDFVSTASLQLLALGAPQNQ
jgi:hypothetical protein